MLFPGWPEACFLLGSKAWAAGSSAQSEPRSGRLPGGMSFLLPRPCAGSSSHSEVQGLVFHGPCAEKPCLVITVMWHGIRVTHAGIWDTVLLGEAGPAFRMGQPKVVPSSW